MTERQVALLIIDRPPPRQLKYKLKMIIQIEHFRESSCKHCKTAVRVEKNLATFLASHFDSLRRKHLLFILLEKKK